MMAMHDKNNVCYYEKKKTYINDGIKDRKADGRKEGK